MQSNAERLNEAWSDDWNDIIRDVIFPDEELRELMMLPKNVTIIEFINEYFIRAGNVTSELLTDEDVRIIYGRYAAGSTNIQNAHTMRLSFDIFVRTEHIHDASNDRLKFRTELIARRLNRLLFLDPQDHGGMVGVYRFFDPSESEMGTRTIGYERYNFSLSYIQYY